MKKHLILINSIHSLIFRHSEKGTFSKPWRHCDIVMSYRLTQRKKKKKLMLSNYRMQTSCSAKLSD